MGTLHSNVLTGRGFLLQFLDLYDGLDEVSAWCKAVNDHLDRKLEAASEKEVTDCALPGSAS